MAPSDNESQEHNDQEYNSNEDEDKNGSDVENEDENDEKGSEEYGTDEEYEEEEFTRFLELPRELQVAVMSELTDLWTLVSFRQTSHEMNTLYLSNKPQILSGIIEPLVQPFYEYYDFHASLHLPPSSIIHPPPGGWPNLDPELCARAFDKTPLAIEVLRRLPFVRGDRENRFTHIGYKSFVIDYSAWKSGDAYPGELAEIVHEEENVTRNKIAVHDGYESFGVVLLLEVLQGQFFEEIVRANPGRWEVEIWDVFEEDMRKYRDCTDVFVPGRELLWGDKDTPGYDAEEMERRGPPSLVGREFGDDRIADYMWVRHLYRKFGWPDEGKWRKEECLKAIREFAGVSDEEMREVLEKDGLQP